MCIAKTTSSGREFQRGTTAKKKRESMCYSGSKGFIKSVLELERRWGRVGVRGQNMRWNTGKVIKYLVAEFQLL